MLRVTAVSAMLPISCAFLADRYYVTFALWREPSNRLSFVCNVVSLRPTHRVELLGNIFAQPDSSWIWAVCIKILGKMSKGIGRF